jgi:nucleoside 2-deoxyribosyltransferase
MMIYLAAPVFTLAERQFNEALANEIERIGPPLTVFLPQRYDKEFEDPPDRSQKMFACLTGALDSCAVVVAILDGPDSDAGVCYEIGYACGREKRVIGVRTDFRGEDRGLNLMLANACLALVIEPSTSTSVAQIAERIVAALAADESVELQSTSEAALLP